MDSRQRRAVERGRIVGMREAGHSISDIARELGLTRQTIQRWISRWHTSGNLKDQRRYGMVDLKLSFEQEYTVVYSIFIINVFSMNATGYLI